MKKNLIIAGERYDMSLFSGLLSEVKNYVQEDLDRLYGKDTVKFDITVEVDGYNLTFYRTYGKFFTPQFSRVQHPLHQDIFCYDACLLFGAPIGDTHSAEDFNTYTRPYIIYYSIDNVLDDYRKACRNRGRGCAKVKSMEVADDEDKIQIKIYI